MKRILALSTGLLLATTGMAIAQHAHHGQEKAKAVTLTGEVLDMTCFMVHPDDATGMDHAKCAKSCMAKGMPVGFMSTDGMVYLLVSSEHESVNAKVADFAGKKSTITGVVIEHHGVKAIELVSVGAASAQAKAPATSAAVYTCSMHPDVRQSEPGNCPKCGMALEKEVKK